MTTEQAWLIDLDGTLYWQLPVRLAMAAELVFGGGLFIAPTLRRFREAHELLRHTGAECCPSPYAEQMRRAAELSGKEVSVVEALVVEWMQHRPGKWIKRFQRSELIAEIRQFRSSGGRTALVSDYPARLKLDRLGVADLFDTVVASGEEGGPLRLKPHPEGYLAAAQRLGVEPNRCVVIGDREDADGAAAAAAGMQFRLIR